MSTVYSTSVPLSQYPDYPSFNPNCFNEDGCVPGSGGLYNAGLPDSINNYPNAGGNGIPHGTARTWYPGTYLIRWYEGMFSNNTYDNQPTNWTSCVALCDENGVSHNRIINNVRLQKYYYTQDDLRAGLANYVEEFTITDGDPIQIYIGSCDAGNRSDNYYTEPPVVMICLKQNIDSTE